VRYIIADLIYLVAELVGHRSNDETVLDHFIEALIAEVDGIVNLFIARKGERVHQILLLLGRQRVEFRLVHVNKKCAVIVVDLSHVLVELVPAVGVEVLNTKLLAVYCTLLESGGQFAESNWRGLAAEFVPYLKEKIVFGNTDLNQGFFVLSVWCCL
jgi:hypothetical protein